jgi:hypothetical protein
MTYRELSKDISKQGEFSKCMDIVDLIGGQPGVIAAAGLAGLASAAATAAA